MTITRIDNSKPGAPTDLTEEAASKPVAPSNLTEQAESKPVAPANLTEQAKNDPAAPVTLTGVAASEPLAPLNLSELSKVDPAAPANLTEIAKSEPLAPTNLSELALSNPVAPVNLTEIARPGINRTLSPLFNFNAALGLPDSVTYIRSSSASYIETYRGPLGRFQKRLTNDYVGTVINYIAYSENLTNAVWQDINTTRSKVSNSNLFKISSTANGSVAYITNSSFTVSNATNYTTSFLVKAGTQGLQARLQFTGTNKVTYFDLDNGRIVSSQAERASITYEGNGTYRISVSILTTTTGAIYLQIARNQATTNVVVGDHFFASEAQIQLSKVLLPYVKTLDSQVSKTFTANPRYEEKGLLVEGASTNLLINSDKITATGGWSEDDVALVGNNTIAPDGSLTATKMVENTLADLHRTFQSTTTTSGITVTESLYVKAGSSTKIAMQSGINGGTSAGTTIFDAATGQFVIQQAGDVSQYVGNGWWRVSKNYTTTSTAVTPQILMVEQSTNNISYTGDGTSFIYIWGAQLEALPFATSYIRTEGSAVSRSSDDISGFLYGLSNEGTLLSQASYLGSTSDVVSSRSSFALTDGATTNRHFFYNPSGQHTSYISAFNGSLGQIFNNTSTFDNQESITSVFSFKNSEAVYYQENVAYETSLNYQPPLGINTILIGRSSAGSAAVFNGHIKRIEIYDLALTANEVKAL